MHADSYPVTFGYGATDGAFYGPHGSVGPYHKGEDRAMPAGTPIIVNGVQIGLSGNTGASSGPHLHIGRWLGGRDTNPGGGGFHFNDAVVTEINQDGVNGKYVRVQGDGASWVYLHMSQQTAVVGQRLVAPAAPAQPAAIVHPYTISTDGFPRQIVFNKNAHKWGMTYDNFTAIANNPIPGGDRNQGDRLTMQAVCHHNIGYSYYLPDVNEPAGYNVLDCDPYIEAPAPPPPPAPVATPAPYVPPAAPADVKRAETYDLVTSVVYYDNALDALHNQNAKGSFDQGNYFVWERDRNMLNLTTNNVKNQNHWINPNQNVIAPVPPRITEVIQSAAKDIPVNEPVAEPAPVAWVPKYTPLRSDRQPIVYKSKNAQDYPILDYSTNRPTIYMPPKHTVKAVDQFTDSKGIVYYRSESMAAENLGYGIPKALLEEAVFDTELTRAERLAMKSASIFDKAYYAWVRNDKRFIDPIKQVLAGINQGRKK